MGLFGRKKKQVDPLRYTCSDEEFVYSREADDYPTELKLLYARDRGVVLSESITLFSKTVYPGTFFMRYNLAIREAKTIIRLSKGYPSEKEMHRILDDLYDGKTDIFNSFFYRCYKAGKLLYAKDEIIQHYAEIPPESYRYFLSLLYSLNK